MLKRFVYQTRGAVAPLFAIAAIPMLGAAGAAVDFSRAYQERVVIQDSLDAAALAGGRKIGTYNNDQIKAEVDKYYYNNIGSKIQNPPALTMDVSGGTINLTTTLHVPTLFLRIMNLDEIVFNMQTQTKTGMGTIEVAMVLDNSTSMCLSCSAAQQNSSSTKIGALKQAANDLATKLYALTSTSTQPDPVKMALIPFAGSVNVGASTAIAGGWVDTLGKGTYAGQAQKSEGAASTLNPYALFAGLKDSSNAAITWGGCLEERPSPYDVDDTAPSSASSPTAEEAKTMFVPMFSPDEPDNWTCTTSDCSYVESNSSRRYNGVPSDTSPAFNNYLPDAGTAASCPSEFVTISSVNTSTETITASAAHGLTNGTRVAFSGGTLPGGLSTNTVYYVLGSGLTTTSFKVSTSSGGTAVNLTSAGSGTRYAMKTANWTCSNGNANCATTNVGRSENQALAGITVASAAQCKYGTSANKVTVPTFNVDSIKGGPNFMCTTTAITPLTTNKDTITAAVTAQQAYGYTNVTAGVAWGLRVLSPGIPFTGGRDYTDKNNLKVMIVMTDGENTYNPYTNVSQNPGSSTQAGKFIKSAYGAFGYLYKGNFGTTSTTTSTVFSALNVRTAAACQKAKDAGIKVYTIAFQVTNANTLLMLSQCASDPSMAYQSGNNQALLDAFTAIGDSITSLRVSM